MPFPQLPGFAKVFVRIHECFETDLSDHRDHCTGIVSFNIKFLGLAWRVCYLVFSILQHHWSLSNSPYLELVFCIALALVPRRAAFRSILQAGKSLRLQESGVPITSINKQQQPRNPSFLRQNLERYGKTWEKNKSKIVVTALSCSTSIYISIIKSTHVCF